MIVATSSCESRGFLWSLREGRESRGGREGDSKHPPSPSGPAQRPSGRKARSALKTKSGTFIYDLIPPSTPLMCPPCRCAASPLRGELKQKSSPSFMVEGAVISSEPLSGGAAAGRRGTSKGRGAAQPSRCLRQIQARRSRGSGLLFASGPRPAQQKQGTATRMV